MASKDTANQIKIRKRADFYLLFTAGCYILILTPKRAANCIISLGILLCILCTDPRLGMLSSYSANDSSMYLSNLRQMIQVLKMKFFAREGKSFM